MPDLTTSSLCCLKNVSVEHTTCFHLIYSECPEQTQEGGYAPYQVLLNAMLKEDGKFPMTNLDKVFAFVQRHFVKLDGLAAMVFKVLEDHKGMHFYTFMFCTLAFISFIYIFCTISRI